MDLFRGQLTIALTGLFALALIGCEQKANGFKPFKRDQVQAERGNTIDGSNSVALPDASDSSDTGHGNGGQVAQGGEPNAYGPSSPIDPAEPDGNVVPPKPVPEQAAPQTGAETTSNLAENLRIDEKGFLRGDNVHQDHNLRNGRYLHDGKPRGIILHKTAGKSCRDGVNTVANKAPHIYICRDGRVIVNGSFDHPRTAAEKFHHDWSLNIEFDANYQDKQECDKRGELTWGQSPNNKASKHWAECYEPLTEAQVKAGREVMELLSKRFDIPLKPAIEVANQAEYVSQQTNVLRYGPAYGARSRKPDNLAPGVLPSFWTARSKLDLFGKDPKNRNSSGKIEGNHDDGPSWNDLERLGIIGGGTGAATIAETSEEPAQPATPAAASNSANAKPSSSTAESWDPNGPLDYPGQGAEINYTAQAHTAAQTAEAQQEKPASATGAQADSLFGSLNTAAARLARDSREPAAISEKPEESSKSAETSAENAEEATTKSDTNNSATAKSQNEHPEWVEIDGVKFYGPAS